MPTVQDTAAEVLVQTAKEAGYDFTTEELAAATPRNEDGEFSEDELEEAAGASEQKPFPITIGSVCCTFE